MKPVVRVNLVSSQPWVEFMINEAKYVVLERETEKKNAFVLTDGRMGVIWKICNSEHITHTGMQFCSFYLTIKCFTENFRFRYTFQ